MAEIAPTDDPSDEETSPSGTAAAADARENRTGPGAHRAGRPRNRRARLLNAAVIGLVLTAVGTLIATAALVRDYLDLTAPAGGPRRPATESPGATSPTPSGARSASGPVTPRSSASGADRWSRATTPPVPTPTAPSDTTPVRASYNHSAGATSVDRVLLPGGTATQDFLAVTPTLTRVGVIAGCNPELSGGCPGDGGSFGRLTLEILEGGQVLATAVVDTANNRTSEGRLDHSVRATTGGRYQLRVINTAGKPIGFYFKPMPGRNDLATTVSGAHHAVDNGPSELDLCALIDNGL